MLTHTQTDQQALCDLFNGRGGETGRVEPQQQHQDCQLEDRTAAAAAPCISHPGACRPASPGTPLPPQRRPVSCQQPPCWPGVAPPCTLRTPRRTPRAERRRSRLQAGGMTHARCAACMAGGAVVAPAHRRPTPCCPQQPARTDVRPVGVRVAVAPGAREHEGQVVQHGHPAD